MSITESARQFVDACDKGRGWEECAQYCYPDATFSVGDEKIIKGTEVSFYMPPTGMPKARRVTSSPRSLRSRAR